MLYFCCYAAFENVPANRCRDAANTSDFLENFKALSQTCPERAFRRRLPATEFHFEPGYFSRAVLFLKKGPVHRQFYRRSDLLRAEIHTGLNGRSCCFGKRCHAADRACRWL